MPSAPRQHHILLIIPTETYRATEFLNAAAALDLQVSVASEQPFPLLSEDRLVQIECDRPEWSAQRLIEYAVTRPIDAIIPIDDQGVIVAALAAQELGQSHNPPYAAAATRNKMMMRRKLWDAEVPQTRFGLAQSDQTSRIAYRVGYPVVLKPLSLAGGQGVIRADNREELLAAEERIRRILAQAGKDPNQPLLVERFQPGPELAVEGILWEGELQILTIFDKPDPLLGPHFEETILIAPSQQHPEVLTEVELIAQKTVQGLGLQQGAVHIELRVTDGHPWVIEIASRSIGGHCSRALSFGVGNDSLEHLILRNALGLKPSGLQRPTFSGAVGAMMIPIPGIGRLGEVSGITAATQIEGITGVEITIPTGSMVYPPPEGDRYLGFIYGKGTNPVQVEETLREAHQQLRIPIS